VARKGPESLGRFAAIVALLTSITAFFSACAGVPVAKPSPESIVERLGSGAAVYAVCEASDILPILEEAIPQLRGDGRFGDLITKTRSAAIALFPKSGDVRFRLVAIGDYPQFQAWLSLSFSRDWKRIDGAKPYWRSKNGLSLAFDSDGAVVVSDASPWAESGGPTIPASFYLTAADSSLRAWIPEPAAAFSRLLGPGGDSIRLPVSELVLSLKRVDSLYSGEFIASAPGESEVRALSAILRFARNLIRSDDPDPRMKFAGKLLRSTSSISGNCLTYSIMNLQTSELASLLPTADAALLYP